MKQSQHNELDARQQHSRNVPIFVERKIFVEMEKYAHANLRHHPYDELFAKQHIKKLKIIVYIFIDTFYIKSINKYYFLYRKYQR